MKVLTLLCELKCFSTNLLATLERRVPVRTEYMIWIDRYICRSPTFTFNIAYLEPPSCILLPRRPLALCILIQFRLKMHNVVLVSRWASSRRVNCSRTFRLIYPPLKRVVTVRLRKWEGTVESPIAQASWYACSLLTVGEIEWDADGAADLSQLVGAGWSPCRWADPTDLSTRTATVVSDQ